WSTDVSETPLTTRAYATRANTTGSRSRYGAGSASVMAESIADDVANGSISGSAMNAGATPGTKPAIPVLGEAPYAKRYDRVAPRLFKVPTRRSSVLPAS